MESYREIVITNKKGIHTRIAAMLAFKSNQINNKYRVTLFIQKVKSQSRIPIASMIALTSLGIKAGEKVIISCQGERFLDEAIDEMAGYLTGEIDQKTTNLDEVDKVLKENTITSEKILESINNGVVVVNENNAVILFNRAAERITGISRAQIIGKKAHHVLDESKLHEVLKNGKESTGGKQVIKNTTIITNRAPIVVDDKIIGAVAVFQDITQIDKLSNELESVKEIKEQLSNILENTNDGICMINSQGIITYVNPAYEEIWGKERNNILGLRVSDILPNSASAKVLKTKKKQMGITLHKHDGVKILSNASPILINNRFRGVVSTYKEITELQKMMDKLYEAEEKIRYFEEELSRKDDVHEAFDILIGRSGQLKEVLTIASKAARTSSTILIQGESGTGKELVARAIHKASNMSNSPFIRVNCAAIPESLLESELFGYEKGAFTGALKKKIGKFELAQGGSIFLDEIGDISKEMQVKLLRVLQEKEIERIGGLETIKVNVRVIAATNRNLQEMLTEGKFREDLYYRLNVIPITLPPLRDRRGDIPLLAEHFIKKISTREGIKTRKISAKALEYLQEYNWPGNIRELENIIERAITLGEAEVIHEESLPAYIKAVGNNSKKELINLIDDELVTMEEYEKEIIKKALEKYKSFNKAGKALGLTHRTIGLKARKYGLV